MKFGLTCKQRAICAESPAHSNHAKVAYFSFLVTDNDYQLSFKIYASVNIII